MRLEHVDVLIVGAGLSGVAAAYYLKTHCPNKTYTIVEGRDAIGGTWDLFKFPGIRSDSDMYTLGYRFRPWRKTKAIAQGGDILDYIKETAAEYDIDKEIRFQHRVCNVSWSSDDAQWMVDIQRGKERDTIRMTCNFLYMCTGYYDYERGYTPEWEGFDRFEGRIIHPQKWDTNFDYTGKRVIVIGSGATAVTMIPAMAEKAGHVTMLQRSPTYIVARPSESEVAKKFTKYLPDGIAYRLTRWIAIVMSIFYFNLSRSKPEQVATEMINGVRELLGPDYDVEKHFTPKYNPWDQRVCLVPDADLFKVIKAGKVSVVTDNIDSFTKTGIQLKSGESLEADVIVTATGLKMKIMNNVNITVDGQPVKIGDTLSYKGLMYSNIPNLFSSFGYTNASWTLKAELICEYVVRLLKHMDRHGYNKAMPRLDQSVETEAFFDFTSGYVQRAAEHVPKQGTHKPWKLYQNYIKDLFVMRYGRLNDGVMHFKRVQQSEREKKIVAEV